MSKLRLLLAFLLPILLGCLIYALQPTFSSSIHSLLPQSGMSKQITELIAQRDRTFKNTLLVLLEDDRANAQRIALSAERVASSAKNSELFSQVQWQIDTQKVTAEFNRLKPYQAAFLTPMQRQSSPNWVMQQWYSPSANSAQLLEDPLLLSYGLSQKLLAQAANSTLIDTVPVLSHRQHSYVLLRLTIAPSYRGIDGGARIESWLAEVEDELVAGRVYSVGVARYSHAAVEQARGEISSIGLVSLFAIILLVLLIFRSFSVLLAVFYPLGVAILGGVLVLSLCFESIHILTLVFGASLLGLSVDYAFHWLLCYQLKSPVVLARTLLAAAMSSVIVFLAQTLTTFEVLAQMGVFAASGLLFAALSVVTLYPWVFNAELPTLQIRLISRLPKLRSNHWILSLLVVLCLGLASLQQVDDDVRKLQPINAELKSQEERIKGVFSQDLAPATIYFTAEDECGLIAKAHELSALLVRAKVEHSRVLVDFFPRCEEQRENISTVQRWLEHDGLYQKLASVLPISAEPPIGYQHQVSELEVMTLSSPVPSFIANQLQWMQTADGAYHSLLSLPVLSPKEAEQLTPQLAAWEAVYVDQVAALNSALAEARYRGGLILAATLLVLGCGLLLLFRNRRPLIRIIPVLVSFIAALGATWLFSQPFSVFTLLALVMLVGLSMDFSIFSARGEQCALLAIVCSALTTILAFGTLGLSEVPVLHNIGTVLTFGILGAMASSLLIRD